MVTRFEIYICSYRYMYSSRGHSVGQSERVFVGMREAVGRAERHHFSWAFGFAFSIGLCGRHSQRHEEIAELLVLNGLFDN